MPILLLASPLRKSWLGKHYWKTPSQMDLPMELEYIPYQELEDRFSRLDTIARDVYPTIWPNVVVFIIFTALFTTAAIGITRSGSGLAIMGQGACFILPVIAVLWIRVRKETKTKARKKFKHRSQKLLRTWTAQDSVTHAIQWKLRLRPKSAAKRWRGRIGNAAQEDVAPEIDAVQENIVTIPVDHGIQFRSTAHDSSQQQLQQLQPQQQQQQQQQQQHEPYHDQQQQQRQPHQQPQADNPTTVTMPTIIAPRRTADVYSALRSSPREGSHPGTQQQQLTQVHSTDSAMAEASSPITTRSKWDPWVELFRDLYCCGSVFKEARVWMIEISIREGVIDEYALPVPSPVYCDYRLPGYEDVMAGSVPLATMVMPVTRQGALMSTTGPARLSATRTSTLPSQTVTSHQPRYSGSPPAYESDSENDSEGYEDNDDDGDDDEDVVDGGTEEDGRRNIRETIVVSTDIGSAGMTSTGNSGNSGNGHRGIEMTEIMVTSGPAGTQRDQQLQQQTGAGVLRTIVSVSTTASSVSATTSRTTLHTMLADKEDDADIASEGRDGREGRGKAD
ncbi:hypothetical protein BGX28_007184 [Mortierella sp. GBA30]|nr:hypothetical protein BGX28_007184 [Mortierella sp. GBA30]